MNFDATQIAWLDQDLAAASAKREQVPWIMVAAHYQLYHSSVSEHWDSSADAFFSDKGENTKQNFRFETCDAFGEAPGCQTLGQWHAEVSAKLEPLLLKYGVDIFNAGHIHDYQSTWPMKNNKVCQKNFENPECPVYIVEGNGGVPGCSGTCTIKECGSSQEWCRIHGNACGAYGRITISNATTLRYDHVVNSNGEVLDTFTITQANHGPFSDVDEIFA